MHNPRLADKQGLDETTREVIDTLHDYRDMLEKDALFSVNNPTILREIYKVWYKNEKLLQKLWKFGLDENYIRFWTFPGCICPEYDNEDAYPTGRYVVNCECPLHGNKTN